MKQVVPHRITAVDKATCVFTAAVAGLDTDRVVLAPHVLPVHEQGYRLEGGNLIVAGGGTFLAVD